mgnify:CR=1 FL=1
MKVRVYKNLHKDCYSVKAMEGLQKGRVIYHASSIQLSDVNFKVYEKGREKVLKEKMKNVHAFVEGNLESIHLHSGFTTDYPFVKSLEKIDTVQKISYNPYSHGFFYNVSDDTPIENASMVVLNSHGVWSIQ